MHKILIYLNMIHLLKSSTYFKHGPAYLQEVYAVIEDEQGNARNIQRILIKVSYINK
jgi:hypothetical protein